MITLLAGKNILSVGVKNIYNYTVSVVLDSHLSNQTIMFSVLFIYRILSHFLCFCPFPRKHTHDLSSDTSLLSLLWF